MIVKQESKVCKKCNKLLSLDNFSIRSDKKTYRNQCKFCRNLHQKIYSKTENGKLVQYFADQKRNLKYKKERAARTAVYRAIQKKLLIPLPCLICGNNSEAHHANYDRPLDVVWLCTKHHKETHKLTKELLNAN
jgi:hypothetical protein